MEPITLDFSKASVEADRTLRARAVACNALLHEGGGAGGDFLGWVSLPSSTSRQELEAIEACAAELRDCAEVIVCIGIGGSYLGAKAVLEALSSPFDWLRRERKEPLVLFAGQNLSEDYAYELLETLAGRSFALVVISKSGTTTEPAIAFRLLREALERRYGPSQAARRIVAVTDRTRGALKTLADEQGYRTFVIPDDVGGRFSVLTPVGLLPLAAAGVDIRSLMHGAREMEAATGAEVPYERNPAAQYAALRNALYERGKKIELLASYEPRLQYVGEWWKQLFGESEGKQGRGIFPASVAFTADLHSMGQYIQQGERILFETVLSVRETDCRVEIGTEPLNGDGLNFLAGKRLSHINRMAEAGVALAHVDGGVPNLRILIERIDASSIGSLLYFFEKACGISGYLLGVNPFDQPGVEAYKKNMFALLDKPGYEELGRRLRERL